MKSESGPILIGGIGLPWLRDLDFGTQWVARMQQRVWRESAVFEDLSYGAHRVLHRLQELVPSRVILVGCTPRGIDPPGTIRRYRLDLSAPDHLEVHERLTEAVMGIIDLDHTLVVVKHWSGFPLDTVVIELEPDDREFGLGFSDIIEAKVDEVADLVKSEIDRPAGVLSNAPMITPPTAMMDLPLASPNASLFPTKPTDYGAPQ